MHTFVDVPLSLRKQNSFSYFRMIAQDQVHSITSHFNSLGFVFDSTPHVWVLNTCEGR